MSVGIPTELSYMYKNLSSVGIPYGLSFLNMFGTSTELMRWNIYNNSIQTPGSSLSQVFFNINESCFMIQTGDLNAIAVPTVAGFRHYMQSKTEIRHNVLNEGFPSMVRIFQIDNKIGSGPRKGQNLWKQFIITSIQVRSKTWLTFNI